MAMRTSVTDESGYISVCRRAAEDAAFFETFRSDPDYTRSVENIGPDTGVAYLEVALLQSPHLAECLDEFARNDDVGGPWVPNPGAILRCPTTSRYVKMVSDLEVRFGSLNGMNVLEVGGGYGGQARLITSYWDVRSYTIVDLPEPLTLAERYLSHFGELPISFVPSEDLTSRRPDLFLSNFAFSELVRPVQERYRDLVIRGSRRGFVTCNFISSGWGLESMSREELVAMRLGARWIPEEPLTHPDNAVLVWGTA